jgi:hypothetical protein
MPIRTELNLRLPNSPGAVAGVVGVLAEERIGIVAMALGAEGQLRLVVDNPVRASGALRAHHHRVTEREVLVVAASSGSDALAAVLAIMADAGVNVEYAYGGSVDPRAQPAVVIGVDDAMRAAVAAGV